VGIQRDGARKHGDLLVFDDEQTSSRVLPDEWPRLTAESH
jgi:hypothetical protein